MSLPDLDGGSPVRVFRSKIAFGVVALGAFCSIGVIVMMFQDPKPGAWASPFSVRVVGVLTCLLLVFVTVRWARIKMVAYPGGISLNNPWRTYRFRWDEIERFSIGAAGWVPAIGRLHLRSGRVIGLYALPVLNPWIFPKAKGASRTIDELNALLAERTQT
jgi:Bacterial PH domain